MEHHEFAATFPLMDETTAEWSAFVADIKANGLRLPIITFEGKILDGRNRARACEVAGVNPRYEQFAGTREDAAKLSASSNLYRRHLDAGQRTVCVARNKSLMAAFQVQAKQALGEHSAKNGTKSITNPPAVLPGVQQVPNYAKTLLNKPIAKAESKRVNAELAKVAGTDKATAHAAITFVRAEEAPTSGDKSGIYRPAVKVKNAFERGSLPVRAAAVLVHQPQEIQSRIITQLVDGKKDLSLPNVKAALAAHKRDGQRTVALAAAASAPSTAPDVRLGRWEDVLASDKCDCLIVDPPYSARTHAASTTRADGSDSSGLTPQYEAWSPQDVSNFVAAWSSRVTGWMVALTDSELLPAWRDAYLAAGRYAFAPLPCVWRGMSVRVSGDGPSSWCVYAVVARPMTKEFASWGTLPGAYVDVYEQAAGGGGGASGGRGKPDWLMRALVRDYSHPGNIVCDPMSGWGSTLVAAKSLGRRVLGGEVDATAHAETMLRLM